MVQKIFAQKKSMRQVWSDNGKRMPVTQLSVAGNMVVRTVSQGENEARLQLAFGDKKMKNANNAQASLLKKLGATFGKRRYFETTSDAVEGVNPGTEIKVEQVLAAGDIIKVTGTTKGLGFAGVVKRHGFAGGPRTHGQSDRERAPGAIGNRTTPGRVFKGKRMAGHGGAETQTLEHVVVVAVNPADQTIWVKGTIPGAFNSLVALRKNGSGEPIALTSQTRELLGLNSTSEQAPTEQSESVEETQA